MATDHGLQNIPGNDGNYPVPHEDFSITIKATGRDAKEAEAIIREKGQKAVRAMLDKKGYSQALLSSYRFIENGANADKYKIEIRYNYHALTDIYVASSSYGTAFISRASFIVSGVYPQDEALKQSEQRAMKLCKTSNPGFNCKVISDNDFQNGNEGFKRVWVEKQ